MGGGDGDYAMGEVEEENGGKQPEDPKVVEKPVDWKKLDEDSDGGKAEDDDEPVEIESPLFLGGEINFEEEGLDDEMLAVDDDGDNNG